MYVKLISDGTWFVKGSEVWNYDKFERISEKDWKGWCKAGIINCRGIRVDHGIERLDGETCNIDEFQFTFVTNKTPYS